jgi:hypothetical protein
VRKRFTADEHLVHGAIVAIRADKSAADAEDCIQGCG